MDARNSSDLDSISYSTSADAGHDLLLRNDSPSSEADTDFPFHATVRTIFSKIKNADTFEIFLQKNRDYDLLANDRLSMIREINLTFELADIITHSRDKTCSFAAYEAIQKLPTLQSIFDDLVNDGHLQMPVALTKGAVLDTQEEHKKIMP